MRRRTFRLLGRRRSAEKVRRRRPRASSELGEAPTPGRDRVRRGQHFSAGPTQRTPCLAYSLGLFSFWIIKAYPTRWASITSYPASSRRSSRGLSWSNRRREAKRGD